VHAEFRNSFLFVAVEELEVLFFEIAHGAALRIADHDRHQHRVHLHFNLGIAVLRWRGCGLLCGLLPERRRRKAASPGVATRFIVSVCVAIGLQTSLDHTPTRVFWERRLQVDENKGREVEKEDKERQTS